MATATVYNAAKKKMMEGTFNLTSDTIKVALVGSGYTPNIDTQDFFDDVTNEISASGYTAGGASLANKSITVDTTNDLAYFDADDVSWTAGATFTVRYAVIYKSTGTAGTSPLLAVIDFVTDRTALSGELFYIEWPTTGVCKIS